MSAVSDSDIERMIRGLTIMGGQILPDGQGYVVVSAIAMLQSLRDELAVRLAAAQHQQAEGEEIMVNTPYDVFTLPLQPSGLSNGPRFVVHVPGPDAQVMPDWDAAPLGATHYQPHQDAYYKRVSASEWYVWSRKNDREPMQWHPSLGTGDNAEWVVRPAEQPTEQHPDDAAVDRFAVAMKAKLNKKRQEGRGGWQSMTAEQLSALLHEHVRKGDPVDVANLAMMLHQNGQVIELPEPPVNVVTDEMVEAVQRIWKTAMRQSVVARMPECGEFGGIAQDADWLLDVLMEARND